MRLAIAVLLFSATLVQADDQSAPDICGKWEVTLSKTHFLEAPLGITSTRITERNRSQVCSADYRITSVKNGDTYPGGPIDDTGQYTTINLTLGNSNCSRDVHYFAISFASGETDAAHFAEFNSAKTVLDFGSLRRVALPADVLAFTADEIAIYRDFLLHYPEQPSEMIGMQSYTTRFVEAYAFGDEPNPPKLNLETPASSARQLPPEVLELTTEDAVTQRAAAQHKPIYPELKHRLKLSEIAFDSQHEHAAFVYSSMHGKSGTSGTVVYEKQNGEWKRKEILNFRIA